MSNTNYNPKNKIYKISEQNNQKILIDDIAEQLKNDLKVLLNLKRTPRNLHIFAIFYKQYNLQKLTNQPVFISTNLLQNRFHIEAADYNRYFEACVAEWGNNEWSYIDKKCREIKSFTQPFIELCEKYAGLKFNSDFYKKYYYSIKQFSNTQMEHLQKIFNQIKKDKKCEGNPQAGIDIILRNDFESKKTNECEEGPQAGIDIILRKEEFDDIITEDFYHSTEDSPFRVYHKLQTLTRSVKSQIFNGYYDIDLQQCFASIAWNILDMQSCNLPFAWMLNPIFKNDLRQKIKSDFNLITIDEAKQKVCALFTEAWTGGEGNVEWYHQLHLEIKRRVKQHLGQNVLWNDKQVLLNTMHKFFTYHEQMIIAKLSAQCDVVLNMHDGIISTTRPDKDYVEYLGFEFLLSINQFVEIQFIKDENFIQQQHILNQMQQIGNVILELNKDYKEILNSKISPEISNIIQIE